MAKERINRPKQQKQPLKSVLRKVFNKLTYFLLALSIVFAIYLIDRSKLLEPHISWEIDGELTTQAYKYDDLIKPLLKNKYLLNLNQIKSKVLFSDTSYHENTNYYYPLFCFSIYILKVTFCNVI